MWFIEDSRIYEYAQWDTGVSGYGLLNTPSLNGPLPSALHAIVTNSALVIGLSGLNVLSG
jgi:hypothetical protein